MVGNFVDSLEPYVPALIILHATISLILAIILSLFVTKRFVRNSREVEFKDKARLEEIANRSLIFKILFRVSLHKNNHITNVLFMFIFIFSMPVLGYVFAIWITWYLKNVSYAKKVANTNILNLDEFGMSFLKVERIFGEGSMSDLMINKYAPRSKKLKALSALSNNPSPANLKIIRQSLSSTDDEIRMFGYAIINKAEKALNLKINFYLDAYNRLNDEGKEARHGNEKAKRVEDNKLRTNRRGHRRDKKERMAEAAKELAPLYWEMIYTELSHDSLKESFLKEVTKYIDIAKEFYIQSLHKTYANVDMYEVKIKEVDKEIRKNENLVQRANETLVQTTNKKRSKDKIFVENSDINIHKNETLIQELNTKINKNEIFIPLAKLKKLQWSSNSKELTFRDFQYQHNDFCKKFIVKNVGKNTKNIEKDDHRELKKHYTNARDIEQRKIIKYNEICTKLYILMGRVHVKRGNYDEANTEFTIAQELHTVESSFILPYLAEIHFLTGNYRVVSSIMNKAVDLELNATLFPVVNQWKAS